MTREAAAIDCDAVAEFGFRREITGARNVQARAAGGAFEREQFACFFDQTGEHILRSHTRAASVKRRDEDAHHVHAPAGEIPARLKLETALAGAIEDPARLVGVIADHRR